MKTISIVLAEDHHVVRQGLRALLTAEPDFTVVGESANGLEVDEVLFESTARLIVNRASFRLETEAVRHLLVQLRGEVRAR